MEEKNSRSSNGGGIEFLEFSSMEYDGPYANMSALGNNNIRYSQHCHNNTNDINYPQATYVGYNGVVGESLGLSTFNFIPNSESKASNFSAIASNDEIDPKEIDQYLMEQMLPIGHNQTNLTAASTSSSTKTKVTVATRMKLCSSSSTSSSMLSSTSPSTCSSTSASLSSPPDLSSPIYKQVGSSDMLHELQPVDSSKITSITSATTATTINTTFTVASTKNTLSLINNLSNHNVIGEKDTADFVTITHPVIAVNDSNYFYSSAYYGNDAVTSSLSSPTGFPQYLQHQSQSQLFRKFNYEL